MWAAFDLQAACNVTLAPLPHVHIHPHRPSASPPLLAGVARSIESDVDNLMRLIRIANILPRGLYVESAVKVITVIGLIQSVQPMFSHLLRRAICNCTR